jgi:hypothetical protein
MMASLNSRLRHLTWHDAGVTAVVFAAILCMSLVMLVCMGFQPGWANGWPMGISKHSVFTLFVTTIFAVASVSGAGATLILLCFLAEHILKRPFVGWTSFVVVLLLVSVTVFMACPHVYAIVHADIVREWP